ncbi:Panacea domain-containing protein [Levilactobacillus parabrevis]|uniref:Panacea domain-containing protein n=1 Tax=Levilactobacillus parabrevis TaxID=357278 RepID=UPI003756AA50
MTDVFKIVNWFRVTSNADMRTIKADELTQMKVMKLLYYVQGTYLAVHGEKAFSNDIIAWKFGPVVREVHEKYSGQRGIVGNLSEDPQAIADYTSIPSDSDLGIILKAVWQAFGDMSATELMQQTHTERPWQETVPNGVLTSELMTAFFKAEVVLQ